MMSSSLSKTWAISESDNFCVFALIEYTLGSIRSDTFYFFLANNPLVYFLIIYVLNFFNISKVFVDEAKRICKDSHSKSINIDFWSPFSSIITFTSHSSKLLSESINSLLLDLLLIFSITISVIWITFVTWQVWLFYLHNLTSQNTKRWWIDSGVCR